MEVINELLPSSRERIEQMMQPGPAGPIYMVNLLKYRERAQYPDGDRGLSGREAYDIYGRGVRELLPRYGGEVVFAGEVTFLSLGQVDELWDEVAVARYPDRATLWAMTTAPEWAQIGEHRAAGLAGQLNIETTSLLG
ncbi:MAG TPA: DUF1330 domain-containing protein [Ilumatobacter sp.]|nr:DUF1330 domain-containing protein [Ilumatobacter sp.]